jgi:hypothetical protein
MASPWTRTVIAASDLFPPLESVVMLLFEALKLSLHRSAHVEIAASRPASQCREELRSVVVVL